MALIHDLKASSSSDDMTILRRDVQNRLSIITAGFKKKGENDGVKIIRHSFANLHHYMRIKEEKIPSDTFFSSMTCLELQRFSTDYDIDN